MEVRALGWVYLFNIWQLLGVPRDSSPGITISILVKDIVSMGNVRSESNLKVIEH